MEQKHMYGFLVKTAIPKNEWDERNETEKRIRDAIWRAHRDTLTGRFQLKRYIKYTTGGKGEKKHDVTDHLYKTIIDCHKKGCAIYSQLLIDNLSNRFIDNNEVKDDDKVEFGAIQKIVNMTLKYLIILNAFEFDNPINIDESKCHCPLDSIILEKLEHTELRWTSISKGDYDKVQEEIGKNLSPEEKPEGNIFYDFKYW